MTTRNIITIDGLAGSGKTTLAKLLAEKLGYVHFSSGILYRVFGFLALSRGVSLSEEKGLVSCFNSHSIKLCVDEANCSFATVDEKKVSEGLYTAEVSEAASLVAAHKAVRKALLPFQLEAYAPKNIVAEGRDMGSVVFPDAPLKFFIVTNEDTRVLRRLNQQYGKNALSIDAFMAEIAESNKTSDIKRLQEEIRIEIQERDKRDSERDLSPTLAAPDAIIIDNNGQTLTQVIKNMYDSAADRGLA